MGGDIFLYERRRGDSMTRRYLGIFLCILFLFSMFGLATKRKSILRIPEGSVGIIAYGSLISLPSMEQTLGRKYEGPIHEVHLAGYERVWTCVRPWNDPQAIAAGAKKIDAYFLRDTERVPIIGAAELNIYPKKKGWINGILYLITNDELLSLDKRERGYRRVDVTDKIEEFRFRGGKVYVYEGLPRSPVASSADKGTTILIKEFLDLVIAACDLRGKDFRDEFDKSTKPYAFPVLSYKNIVREKTK
ncbi:MAG: gamma-glutamylcyclotransferase [Candidatus Atribacteria bacterium]|nr:gamma-glutamylcyclotransferase [Candidatus Atribacteria bacterium]